MIGQGALGSLLLAAVTLSGFPGLVTGKLVSSLLSGSNFTVPEYVTRYAPLIWLHSDDPFKPSDLLNHVRHTTPMVDGKPVSGSPELNLDNLASLNELGDQAYLTSKNDPTTEPAWLFGETPDSSGRISNAVPCCVILVQKGPRDLDAFFFYFYSYNRGANISQVLEPLDKLLGGDVTGMHFGDHVGDWEHNMIRFRDGKPTGIYYSQHGDGRAYEWDDTELSKQDGRPIVFSAYGSHANYASGGYVKSQIRYSGVPRCNLLTNHPQHSDQVHDAALVDYCDAGYRWDPILSGYFYHFDPSSITLTPLDYPASSAAYPYPTSFLYYKGTWGDSQYPDSDPRQKTVSYFHLLRFTSGPKGPLSKSLVRKGLYPDQRHKKTWMEEAVGLYMSWYPCCLKSWRGWVLAGFVVSVPVLVLVALRIKYTLVRYNYKKGYKRVEIEVPLDDMARGN
ncbi:hypothetical protein T440DRAFT_260367 [Plenodomus tracheiphilus IPT5]|uniref:Vacuolar protein sorting-associated protein 62 n=1 Tax=Plenodomus tracheiphilus IPT5 TaxID=1408161 RepID=A0A6A7ASJ8_9PLEO|nr:hypothetical protein T440DRAFT_260367 [Plenodomus tracheiphilus IPT5]